MIKLTFSWINKVVIINTINVVNNLDKSGEEKPNIMKATIINMMQG